MVYGLGFNISFHWFNKNRELYRCTDAPNLTCRRLRLPNGWTGQRRARHFWEENRENQRGIAPPVPHRDTRCFSNSIDGSFGYCILEFVRGLHKKYISNTLVKKWIQLTDEHEIVGPSSPNECMQVQHNKRVVKVSLVFIFPQNPVPPPDRIGFFGFQSSSRSNKFLGSIPDS